MKKFLKAIAWIFLFIMTAAAAVFLTLYLLMGWVAVVVLVPLWNAMPHSAFWWVVTEGLFYTIGAYFFRLDDKHAFYHAIWHVFIMLGSLSHIIALFIILR